MFVVVFFCCVVFCFFNKMHKFTYNLNRLYMPSRGNHGWRFTARTQVALSMMNFSARGTCTSEQNLDKLADLCVINNHDFSEMWKNVLWSQKHSDTHAYTSETKINHSRANCHIPIQLELKEQHQCVKSRNRMGQCNLGPWFSETICWRLIFAIPNNRFAWVYKQFRCFT